MPDKIRVGIIGASPGRSWAARAHIPAMQALPEFEIVALSTTRMESALAAAKQFGIPLAFDNHHALVNHPDVDVVVVAVKVPFHFELVTAALDAGKAVYCEWPLGNGLDEAERMAEHARRTGVLAVAGLQARAAPAIAYARDLIAQGYLGDVLSTTLVGSGMNWGPVIDEANAYTADIRNGATMLTIPFGHTVDALCCCLGEFRELSAVLANRRTMFRVAESGATEAMSAHDQICVSGLLESGAAVSIHYRGGVSRGTNLLWEINGSEGDLQLSAPGGHAQMFEMTVRGGNGAAKDLQPLPIPEQYFEAPASMKGMAFNLAQAYRHFSRDYSTGSRLCPTFDDAVARHRLLRAVEIAASGGRLNPGVA